MRVGSLFSGIGGLELGLERAIPGARTVWQVEQDEYARAVLAKHWPNARRYQDVREAGAHNLEPVDVICGDSPAKTSAWPEGAQDSTGPDRDCGQNTRASFASFDPDTSSWKTSQRCLVGGWVEFSETWPRAGTMRRGTVYQLPPSAPLTAVTGSFWLPTPTVSTQWSNRSCSAGAATRLTLHGMARQGMWPDLDHTAKTGPLSPAWVECVMGFPVGFTDLDVSETP